MKYCMSFTRGQKEDEGSRKNTEKIFHKPSSVNLRGLLWAGMLLQKRSLRRGQENIANRKQMHKRELPHRVRGLPARPTSLQAKRERKSADLTWQLDQLRPLLERRESLFSGRVTLHVP